ncbi:Microcin-J25 export ATP-binding/permease protein McjD [Halioglobus japonicus]|nr:Microcin-J25 export ATP-binding/permease protein McjD [Halioglobus japonicus]
MKALLPIIRLMLSCAPRTMVCGAILSVIALVMGIALLGLSGWFITATGIAGIAGIGIAFDVFRPSAGVRFLALGRTVTRYGERLLTHDATLRSLAMLRVMVLRHQVQSDARALARLRSEAVLTRIVSDVDALDGVILRFLLPGSAALITHLAAFVALGWLVSWSMATAVLLGYLPIAMLILWYLARHTKRPSAEVEAQTQRLRRGTIDMIRHRQSLILTGALAAREAQLTAIDTQTREAARTLDRVERRTGAALSILVAAVTALALVVGEHLIVTGIAGPAVTAIGVFVALALAETLLPLRRGVAELGKMLGAARRIGAAATTQPEAPSKRQRLQTNAPVLEIHRPTLALRLEQGNAAVLTGPSGSGKTTLMMEIAGLAESKGITIFGVHPRQWSDPELRDIVTMVPQRSVLIAGTVRENMRLASGASDDQVWRALEVVALDKVIAERGGLDASLSEAGLGLSGGQTRRLVLARAILKRPKLLLLDEPTEGLDAETADRMLHGIRAALPQTTILATLHRFIDHSIFEQTVTLN